MQIAHIITGLILIGIGFLVKAFPNLIAGYNTMPKGKKEKVDIEGLSTMMRNALIVMGVLVIAGDFLFSLLGWDEAAVFVIPVIVLPGTLVVMIKSQKFNIQGQSSEHGRDRKRISGGGIFTILLILFIIAMLIHGSRPSKAIITDDFIRFTGQYGVEIAASEIESVELVDVIPLIQQRTNGLGLGSVQKGTFKLEDWGKCRLLLHSKNPPFLIITKISGEKLIVNYKDETTTEELYRGVSSTLKKEAVSLRMSSNCF